ncbi:hypothetical protein MCACP_01930 [Neomoorella carbonis]
MGINLRQEVAQVSATFEQENEEIGAKWRKKKKKGDNVKEMLS